MVYGAAAGLPYGVFVAVILFMPGAMILLNNVAAPGYCRSQPPMFY